MNYDKTELNFLEKDVIRAFGEEEGRKIFLRASKLYAELAVTTDYQKSATFERQLRMLVYPVIAYYKTLLAFGYKTSSALGLVRNETEKAAAACADVLASQMRPVFPYHAFKRNIKNFIEYKFPAVDRLALHQRLGARNGAVCKGRKARLFCQRGDGARRQLIQKRVCVKIDEHMQKYL